MRIFQVLYLLGLPIAAGVLLVLELSLTELRFVVAMILLLVWAMAVRAEMAYRRAARIADAVNELRFGRNYRKHRQAVEILLRSLASENPAVCRSAHHYLKEITGQDFGPDQAAWRKWWAANKATFTHARERPPPIPEGPESPESPESPEC